MYTKEQVDEMLSQVEQEFEKTLGSIKKSEETEEVVEEAASEETESQEEVIAKSEEAEEVESEEDYETMDDLYNSMTKSEKEAHYASIKKSLFGESSEEEAEEAMAKSEETEEAAEETEEKEEEMFKSENDKLKAENEELKKNIEVTNELLEKLFSKKKAPAGKAITATNYIAKSEEIEGEEEADITKLSKKEITDKLNSVDFESLTKSEREAINDFYLKNGSVDKIKHLIKE